MRAPGAPAFARLERLAAGPAGFALLAAWAFAEAIVLPVVPDVVLGLLALVAPRRSLALFGAIILGALAGTAVLYALASVAPEAVKAMLLALPGIPAGMLDAARDSVARGDPRSLALLGPGTPLKVFTFAWATGPATPVALAAGVVLNRITRIGPSVVAMTVTGRLAPGFLRRHDRLVMAVYGTFWLGAYALLWR